MSIANIFNGGKMLLLGLLFIVSCTDCDKKNNTTVIAPSIQKNIPATISNLNHSAYETILIEAGMVNIADVDSTIMVHLKYSTVDNFMNEDLYGDFSMCYLQKETAKMLSNAQKKLKQIDKNLSLIIYDGVRPRSVQRRMWDSGKLPKKDRQNFIADPDMISLHNFGAAVDISIVFADSSELDMGTKFDHIGELAYPSLETYFLDNGMLGQNQVENREVLRKVMRESGFIANEYEWWHFASIYRVDALKKYAIVENFETTIQPEKSKIALSSNANIEFRVQLAASTTKLSAQHPTLKGVDYKEYFHNGMYKYTTGEFNSLSATYEYRDSLINRGYQAFVVCFYNNERIDIREAMNLMQ